MSTSNSNTEEALLHARLAALSSQDDAKPTAIFDPKEERKQKEKENEEAKNYGMWMDSNLSDARHFAGVLTKLVQEFHKLDAFITREEARAFGSDNKFTSSVDSLRVDYADKMRSSFAVLIQTTNSLRLNVMNEQNVESVSANKYDGRVDQQENARKCLGKMIASKKDTIEVFGLPFP